MKLTRLLAHAAGLFAFCALLISGLVALMTLGPSVEASIAPVWSQMTAEWYPRQTPGTMAAELNGFKERGGCRLLEVTAMVRDGSTWRRAEIEIDGRPSGTLTRPSGWQSLGTWRFSRAGDRLRITGHFACHALWDTPATLGEWAAPGGRQ